MLFGGLLGKNLPVDAQIVNIEDARRGRDSLNHVAGKVGVSFSVFNQNAGKNQPNNYLQFTLNGDVAYHTPLHTYLLFNYLNYLLVNYDTKSQRNTVAQQGYVHFRVNLWQARRISYELFSQAQSDKARGLQWRTLGGGYFRWRVMKQQDKNITVFLGTGLMHEHEEWKNPEQMDRLEVSNLLKSTSYASAKLKLQNNVEANTIVYYQVGYSKLIDDFRNRVSGEISLGVKLTKVLALRTKFNCTYEDEPIVPVTRFVYSIVNGIEVVF
jgi:putative salt-induced outer membrane protein YdiY